MLCHKCGTQPLDGANFCSHCGAPIPNPEHSSFSETSTDTSQNRKNEDGEQGPEHNISSNPSKDTSKKQKSVKGDNDPEHSSSSETSKDTTQKQTSVNEDKGDHGQVQGRKQKLPDDLRILLVGRTGHGKSATGNSILGLKNKHGFHVEKSRVSVTKKFERRVTARFGKILDVVDTPGILDTSYDHEFVYEQLTHCIAMTLPGFNAVFLVLNSDRFTTEMIKTVEIFFQFFGRGVDEYTFVLFTNMKTEKEMKNYIKDGEKKPEDEGEQAFQALRKRCQNKMLFIDNEGSKKRKKIMVRNIITAVDEANAKASRPYFQNRLTREIVQKAKNFYRTHVCGLTYERSKEDLRILLIGLPGHGKSATGNSILGENMSTGVGNAFLQTQSRERNGRKIMIVEFPGMHLSSQSDGTLKEQLLQTEKLMRPGFHAVCFVIDPKHILDVKDQFKPIIEYFRDEANDYAFVIITFTKSEDELEKNFLNNIEVKHLEPVLKFCKGKELYIDNKVSPQEKEEMIKDMFIFIDSENANKDIPFFSSRFKQLAEAAEIAEAIRVAEAAKADEAYRNAEAARAAFDAKLSKAVQEARDAEAARFAEAAEVARNVEAAKAAKAIEAAKAADAARAVEAERAAKAVEAARVAEAARAVADDKAAKADEAAKAAEDARALEAVNFSKASEAAQAAEDARAAEAEKAAKAEEAAKAAEAARDAEADKAAKAEEAAKAAEAARDAEAAKASKALKAEKAAEAAKVALTVKAAKAIEATRAAEAARDAEREKTAKAIEAARAAEAARDAEAKRAAKAIEAASAAVAELKELRVAKERNEELHAAYEAYREKTEKKNKICQIL